MVDLQTSIDKNIKEPSTISEKHREMMGRGQGVKVCIYGDRGSDSSNGEIRVQFWNKKERILRALKFAGICWGGAVVSVFFPVLHFVLVPGFLIAGPIVGIFMLKQESVVLGGEGVCPSCHAFLPIVRSSYKFPISELCTHCHCGIKIELADKMALS